MAETGWVRVAAASDIKEGQAVGVRVGDRDIAICHLKGGSEFRAIDNICSHEYAQLSDGWLEGDELECPLHAGRFDVRTGQALCPPVDRDLEVFEVRIDGNDVLIRVP